jgi:hypothetical protein
MNPLQTHELAIKVDDSAGRLRLDWSGKSTSRDPSQVLAPFLDQVLSSASAGGKTVEMHFEAMEHFNSSTVAELIRVINKGRTSQVPLTVFYNASCKWQELSFKALERAMRPFQTGLEPSVRILSVADA